MTAEQWVQNVLSSKLNENGDIQLSVDQYVTVSTFCTFFRDCLEDETVIDKYVGLSGDHTFMWGDPSQEYTRTAEKLGYKVFFDQWHEEGLI